MMTDHPSNGRPREACGGFAIIVTVSMLALLAVLAVGMLTLSSVTVRAVSLRAAETEARANARLGLILALGELQRNLGPDGAVTAPSAILDGDPATPELEGVRQAHLTGV
jgi:type II secretory pathway component PulK